jgi:hypothetical protein
MPWNYPLWQVIRFAAPALMAGNVCLLKHASSVPQSALALEDLFLRAGFPQGAFQTLLIGSSKVDALLADPRVVAATLTGSEGAGVQVGVSAAKRIKKVVLELGGSDPFIVMRSANLDQAVATAVKARIANNGQSCIAAKRFIVDEAVADEFEKQFVSRMESIKIGDPLDPATELGPLSSSEALKELHTQVEISVNFSPLSPLTRRPTAKSSSGPWLACSARKMPPRRFASRTTHASDWGRVSGPRTQANESVSSGNWKPEWSLSTKWWRPIPAYPLGGSSNLASDGSWARGASESLRT